MQSPESYLVLGGAGLVGSAVCRRLLARGVERLTVAALTRAEAEEAVRELAADFPRQAARLEPRHGNLFVRRDLNALGRGALMACPEHRRAILDDTLGPLGAEGLDRSTLFHLLMDVRADVVIDCVNTATALAYQDVYGSAAEVRAHLDAGHGIETFRDVIERHLCTLDTPQLIRHVQVLNEGLRRAGTRAYVKVGTSGTGGMGLNIPYTHSEERPSRVLLSKSAMAGAHSLLLFLMARTPDGPAVKEIKPAAAIAWKDIGFGEIRRGGRPLELHDADASKAVDVVRDADLGDSRPAEETRAGGTLEAVFIDTGENGVFTRSEFEVVSALGQMEFVTPEEIALQVEFELDGRNSGYDVVAALDQSVLGPTYRAGVLRERALTAMRALEAQHDSRVPAFEMLGPPRLSKLLFEAELLRRHFGTYAELTACDPERDAPSLAQTLERETTLRRTMISVGIPVLLPDGERLLRGPVMVIPKPADRRSRDPERLDRWAGQGWVDLRPESLARWRDRARRLLERIRAADDSDRSSRHNRFGVDRDPEGPIEVGRWIASIFNHEEAGARLKR